MVFTYWSQSRLVSPRSLGHVGRRIQCLVESNHHPPWLPRREQSRRSLGQWKRHLSARSSKSDRRAIWWMGSNVGSAQLVASLLALGARWTRSILLRCRLGRHKLRRIYFYHGTNRPHNWKFAELRELSYNSAQLFQKSSQLSKARFFRRALSLAHPSKIFTNSAGSAQKNSPTAQLSSDILLKSTMLILTLFFSLKTSESTFSRTSNASQQLTGQIRSKIPNSALAFRTWTWMESQMAAKIRARAIRADHSSARKDRQLFNTASSAGDTTAPRQINQESTQSSPERWQNGFTSKWTTSNAKNLYKTIWLEITKALRFLIL